MLFVNANELNRDRVNDPNFWEMFDSDSEFDSERVNERIL